MDPRLSGILCKVVTTCPGGAELGAERGVAGQAGIGLTPTGDKFFPQASHPEIDFRGMMADPFVLACRHDHGFARRSQVAWKELSGQRVIIVGRTSGNRALIDNALAQHGGQLGWTYEVSHLSGSLGLVEAGLGVAILPRLATPAEGHQIIRTVRLTEPEVTRTIGIVRRRGAALSPLAGQFLEMLLESWKLTSSPRQVRRTRAKGHRKS